MSDTEQLPLFSELGLAAPVLKALQDVGYERPSPIQAAAIPHLMAGHDLLGQAQTGTGKTAAFALPLLSRLEAGNRNTQILVLAPTRELALQVAEACQRYAHHMPDFHVLPIYGGQAGWISHAVRSFQTMPARNQGRAISPARLIAVLQGWELNEQQIAAQKAVAEGAGVAGFLVAYAKIEQSWQPRILKWK